MFRGMDMNGNKMSGEMIGQKMSGETAGNETTGGRITGKKKFPIGWLLTVAALSFFLGHFWSYVPVARGIVSLFVFSKFLAGLSGTHFLL